MDELRLRKMVESGMSFNAIARSSGCSLNRVIHWCKKYGIESKHEKFRRRDLGPTGCLCECGEDDPSLFHKNRPSQCRSCRAKTVSAYHARRRQEYKNLMGASCAVCGYDKFQSALEFHHVDPESKDPNFNSLAHWSRNRAMEELQKCILLCACCHRATHSRELSIEEYVK